MQYDENAEKYGYEGEMTPLKCDKLKPYTYDDMIDGDADINIEYYPKSEVDEAIAELKAALNEAEEARYEACADAADYYQENRKLKRALWITRAKRAIEKISWFKLWNASISTMNPEDGARQEYDKWMKNLGKFLKKAEEYK